MHLMPSSSHFRGRRPSKLAYRKVLCDTTTQPEGRGPCLPGEKEEKSIRVPSFSTVQPSYPLFLFPPQPVSLVCPQEVETRKAVGGNISTNPRTHTRPSFRENSTPRDVYFCAEKAYVEQRNVGNACTWKPRGRHRSEHGWGLHPRNNTRDIWALLLHDSPDAR